MPISQREYVEFELDVLRRRLADVEDGTRQVPPTEDGQAYRARLREDIRELEELLANEDADA
jgi:hypothetical protein